MAILLSNRLNGRFEPTTFLFGAGIFSIRLYRQSNLGGKDYSWIIKTFSSAHFTSVHANLIEQTTSSIELVVLKRRIIVVTRKDSTCLLLHRLEQHWRILSSKENYRTLAQSADPCENHFGDMIWKIPNPTLNYIILSIYVPIFLHIHRRRQNMNTSSWYLYLNRDRLSDGLGGFAAERNNTLLYIHRYDSQIHTTTAARENDVFMFESLWIDFASLEKERKRYSYFIDTHIHTPPNDTPVSKNRPGYQGRNLWY